VGLSTNRINGVLAIGLCAIMVAGCSGGGASIGTSATRPQSQNPVLTAQSTKGALSTKAAIGNVTFTIRIKPKAKTGRITPKYVSPSTQSLKILTDGANPVVVGLTPSSPNCSPTPTVPGAYLCTAADYVPAGNHVFTVTTYDLTDAEGNVLSTNTTGAVDVKPTGTTTTVSLVLEGAVHYVVLALVTSNPPVGSPVTIGLTAILEDADQNLILGSARYESPVTLTTTDSSNGPLSKTVLNSPADASDIMAHYTGANVASITYSATANGLSAANVSTVVLTPGALAQHLYVLNDAFPNADSVSVFNTAHENAPLPTITGGGLYKFDGDRSFGVAVDATGKLYVGNEDSNSVSVFDTTHGNAVLPTITGGGLDGPDGVAVDASGKLYVANNTIPGSVSVFDTAHGNTPLPTITGGGLDHPWGLAVDASGKLYVTNYTIPGSVSVFDTAHGNTPLPAIAYVDLEFPWAVSPYSAAVDASGKLYVGNGEILLVFDTAHGNAQLSAITGGALGLPEAVAVDASGKLYVANIGNNSVSVFDTAHDNAVLPAITGGGLHNPIGVAVDASGKL
jgi:YVTN family beta-propeller protein